MITINTVLVQRQQDHSLFRYFHVLPKVFFFIIALFFLGPGNSFSAFAEEETEYLEQWGVGFYTGLNVPGGWFDDVGMNSALVIGGSYFRTIDSLYPGLMFRTTLHYEENESIRRHGMKYNSENIELYGNLLYFFDLGIPLKLYAFGGCGLDYFSLTTDGQSSLIETTQSDNLGVGIKFGGGMYVKPVDLFAIYLEAEIQTSTWGDEASFGDNVNRFFLGISYYVKL